jgi:hypothetical protein
MTKIAHDANDSGRGRTNSTNIHIYKHDHPQRVQMILKLDVFI